MNIILIGMPGCGKSTVGVLLAKALQYGFIDCDLLIQQRCKTSLQNIIDTKGLSQFLKEEEATLLTIEDDCSIVATGGSAVYSHKAMEHLKKNGIVVYLSLPFSDIESRLTNIKTRGVAMDKSTTLSQLYNERCPLYQKYADVTIDAHGLDIEQTVEAAAKKLISLL